MYEMWIDVDFRSFRQYFIAFNKIINNIEQQRAALSSNQNWIPFASIHLGWLQSASHRSDDGVFSSLFFSFLFFYIIFDMRSNVAQSFGCHNSFCASCWAEQKRESFVATATPSFAKAHHPRRVYLIALRIKGTPSLAGERFARDALKRSRIATGNVAPRGQLPRNFERSHFFSARFFPADVVVVFVLLARSLRQNYSWNGAPLQEQLHPSMLGIFTQL